MRQLTLFCDFLLFVVCIQDQRRLPHNSPVCMSSIQVTYTDNKIVSFETTEHIFTQFTHYVWVKSHRRDTRLLGAHPKEGGMGSFSEDETQEAHSITVCNDKACVPWKGQLFKQYKYSNTESVASMSNNNWKQACLFLLSLLNLKFL